MAGSYGELWRDGEQVDPEDCPLRSEKVIILSKIFLVLCHWKLEAGLAVVPRGPDYALHLQVWIRLPDHQFSPNLPTDASPRLDVVVFKVFGGRWGPTEV